MDSTDLVPTLRTFTKIWCVTSKGRKLLNVKISILNFCPLNFVIVHIRQNFYFLVCHQIVSNYTNSVNSTETLFSVKIRIYRRDLHVSDVLLAWRGSTTSKAM